MPLSMSSAVLLFLLYILFSIYKHANNIIFCSGPAAENCRQSVWSCRVFVWRCRLHTTHIRYLTICQCPHTIFNTQTQTRARLGLHTLFTNTRIITHGIQITMAAGRGRIEATAHKHRRPCRVPAAGTRCMMERTVLCLRRIHNETKKRSDACVRKTNILLTESGFPS